MSSLSQTIRALVSPVQQVRDEARARLTAAGPAAIEPLIQALADPDAAVRKGAALVLGEMGAEGAIQALATIAKSDPDLDLRPIAVRALSDIARHCASPAIKLALIDQLRADDMFSRALACRGLGHIGDEHCRRAIKLALRDPEEWVRQAAQQALASPADKPDAEHAAARAADSGQTPGLLQADDSVSALVAHLMSLDLTLQRQAQRALAAHGARAVDRVARLLWDQLPTTRRAAAETLGLIGEPAAVASLANLIADPETSTDMLAVALHATARILASQPGAGLAETPPVVALLTHDDAHVRAAAAAVAVWQAGPARAAALDLLLEEEGDWLPETVLPGLAKAASPQDREILPRLVDILGRLVDPSQQRLVLSAMTQILADGQPDQAVIGPTSFFLSSQDPDVQVAALEVIARACERLDAPTLQGVLLVMSAEPRARRTALELIARSAPRDSSIAAEGIRPVLEDPDPELAALAARTLGEIDGQEAIDALIETANSKRGPVVAAAAQVLAALDRSARVIAVRRPDGRWERKLQLRCTSCDSLLGWARRDGREELRCSGCQKEHVLGPTGKVFGFDRTPLGACLCCERKQLLIRREQSETLVCPVSGEVHIRPYDQPTRLRLLRDLPLGACGCCAQPQPLVRVEGDRVVCHRTRREHAPAARGFVLAEAQARVADDVAAINQALLEGTLGIGQSGLPTVSGQSGRGGDEES